MTEVPTNDEENARQFADAGDPTKNNATMAWIDRNMWVKIQDMWKDRRRDQIREILNDIRSRKELELVIVDQHENIWLRLGAGSDVSDQITVEQVMNFDGSVIVNNLLTRMTLRADITRGPLELRDIGDPS
ncbi:hypothetical protein [Paracoccus versutus]|uniref:hypothetical protein n=1 Tax=Paracoccus versutus TaxID=34007 RepID=UPI000DF78664|nr:hypothetical protein [Paracoccus versutus]RDD72934.1 hypothetical protein DVR11_03130 [Paracoccus versutus]